MDETSTGAVVYEERVIETGRIALCARSPHRL